MKVSGPITGSVDGAMLYDSHSGPLGALRWRDATDWQQFTLIREVVESGTMSITLALTGLGEVQFDDLRVIPHSPRDEPPPTIADEKREKGSTRSPLDLFERLPGLRGGATRRR